MCTNRKTAEYNGTHYAIHYDGRARSDTTVHVIASGTSLIRAPMGQKKVSLLVRCPHFNACKSGTVYTWGGKVSCLERCPQLRSVLIERERGCTVSPLTCGIAIWIESKMDGLFHSVLIWDDTSVHTLRLVSELRP